MAELRRTRVASAEEERRQHVASLKFHAQAGEFAGNEMLGFFIGFMGRC
jgi:GntR family transcriptional regulator, transcriptional repressor for pyruvate dehydrogenase complex